MAQIDGTSEADTLNGTIDADEINGKQGADVIDGGAGDDRIEADRYFELVPSGNSFIAVYYDDDGEADQIDGGADVDWARLAFYLSTTAISLDFSDSSVLQTAADGTTIVNVEQIDFTGGSGDDLVQAGALADTLDGGVGDDELNGGGGDDMFLLSWSEGADVLDGEAGIDRIELDFLGSSQAVAFDLTDPGVSASLPTGASFVNIEAVDFVGGSGDDVVTGGAEADDLNGGLGDDELNGAGGDDVLEGGNGTNILSGGADNDRIVVDGSNGTQTIDGGSGDDLLELFIGSTTTGVSYDFSDPAARTTLLGGSTVTGIEQVEIIAGRGDDAITGGGLDDKIEGRDGSDQLSGGGGADFLNGDGGGTFAEGFGADILSGGAGDDILVGDRGADQLTGGTGADDLSGGEGNDTFFIAAGDEAAGETIAGDAGADAIETASATLDLTGMAISGVEEIRTLSNSGTAFTVDALQTALLIRGGSGSDSVTVNGITLTAEQRNAILAQDIESVTDESGTYAEAEPRTTVIYFSQYSDGLNSSLRAWAPTTNWNANVDEAEVIVPLDGEGSLSNIRQLYVVPGTEAGGRDRLYFISPGAGNPDDPSNVNINEQLWTSDGTEGGTRSLTPFYSSTQDPVIGARILSGTSNGLPIYSLYFSAYDADGQNSGNELYIAPGATLADGDPLNDFGLDQDINPGADDSNPNRFVQGHDEFYFVADNGSDGETLWWSNGGSAPLQVGTGANENGFYPAQMVYDQEGSTLFFTSDGLLYRANGASVDAITVNTYQITGEGVQSGDSWNGVNLVGDFGGNGVLFTGGKSSYGFGVETEQGLWRFTSGQGVVLIDEDLSVYGSGIRAEGAGAPLYFLAQDFGEQDSQLGLWRSDGSAPFEIVAGLEFSGFTYEITGATLGSELYFVARETGATAWSLYRTDGTVAIALAEFTGTDQATDFVGFKEIDGWLYFFVEVDDRYNLYRINSVSDPQLIAADVDASAGVVGANTAPVLNPIEGTAGNDPASLLEGTEGRDEIKGLDGDDYLNGKGNRDRLDGGAGSDWALYEDSLDAVNVSLLDGTAEGGDAQGDELIAIENLRGSAFDDVLTGDDGANRLEGLAGVNTLIGNGGADVLDAGVDGPGEAFFKTDVMFGGAGNDTYYVYERFDEARELVDGVDAGGTDTIFAADSYTLLFGEPIEVLRAADLAATAPVSLTGNNLGNIVIGNAGANLIDGGTGNDLLRGRGGNDTYFVTDADDKVDESAAQGGGGTDTVIAYVAFNLSNAKQAIGSIENLTLLGFGDIDGTGNALANTISGSNGDNIIDGKAGADRMSGNGGDDTYMVDNVRDKAIEQAGQGLDLVKSSVTFTLGAHVENLILTGTKAISATGNEAANKLTGNSGANKLNGKGGADTMAGGDGDDLYIVDNAGDKVVELARPGVDLVKSSVAFTLGANVENLTLTGSAAIAGSGNGAANKIVGNGGANILNGKGGADTMAGGGGNDTYVLDNAGDKALEFAGKGSDLVKSNVTFTLGAYVENLTLTGAKSVDGTGNGAANKLVGNGSANTLKGLGKADTIDGGGGGDKIYGGAGNDVLKGGAGKDGFYFDTALSASANVDKILDFSRADDTIFLDVDVFKKIATGTLSAGAFHVGKSAADADDRIVYDKATGKIFYDADGSGGAAAILFAQVTVGTVLTNADFVGVI